MESDCGRKVGRRPENTRQGKKFCFLFFFNFSLFLNFTILY